MKSLHPLVLALLVFPLGLGKDEEPTPEKEKATILALLEVYRTACEARDISALSAVFAHDDDAVIVVATQEGRVMGWRNIEAAYKSWFTSSGGIRIAHKSANVKVDSAAKAAWLSCQQDAEFSFQGRQVKIPQARVTWALVKRDGKWQVIQAHWSTPVAAGPVPEKDQ